MASSPPGLTRAMSRRTEQVAFHGAFTEAGARAGLVEVRRVIAGARVRLLFAGSAMIPYHATAFEHLPPWDGSAELTIHVWDSASTGIPLPLEAGSLDEPTRRGLPSQAPVEGYWSAFQGANAGLSVYHAESTLAGYWMHDAVQTPYYDRASPLKVILHWFLGGRGIGLIHAAAVGWAGRCTLIAGASGSGKSTTALGALVHGLDYLADDHCAVSWNAAHPVAHALYSTGKLTARSLDLLPELRPLVTNAERLDVEKAVILVARHFPEQVACQLPIASLLIPRVVEGRPRFVRLGSGAALAALAPSTLLQLPAARAEALTRMARLVQCVPAYVFEVGPSAGDTAQAIRAHLCSLPGGSQ